MKRGLDLLASLLGLLVLSPLLLGLAALIRFTDGGPVLFRQWRVGRDGRDFRIWKFRTMRSAPKAEQGRFDAGSSARVTRLGAWLRHRKLDELPQLWNVLVGEMSLVGPRPEVRRWVEAYPQRWAFVHRVRPGITDPASVLYRDEEELLAAAPNPEQTYREQVLPHKLRIYEDYVRRQSLAGDLRILGQTARIVWTPHGLRRRRSGTADQAAAGGHRS